MFVQTVHCPAGYHRGEYGVCLQCEPGYSSNGTFSLAPTECDPRQPGSIASSSGSENCSLCSPGTYQVEGGKASCIDCPSGSYCVEAPVNSIPCNAGSYSGSSAPECTLCDQGFYQAQVAESTCIKCPSGRTTQNSGSADLSDCISVVVNFVIGYMLLPYFHTVCNKLNINGINFEYLLY